MRYPIALSNLNVFKKQHPTFSGRDAISFCYDYLCKIVPQKLPATKLKLPLCSWASPSFVKLEGIKRTHPLLSMKLYKKYSSINLQRCLFETDKIPVTLTVSSLFITFIQLLKAPAPSCCNRHIRNLVLCQDLVQVKMRNFSPF